MKYLDVLWRTDGIVVVVVVTAIIHIYGVIIVNVIAENAVTAVSCTIIAANRANIFISKGMRRRGWGYFLSYWLSCWCGCSKGKGVLLVWKVYI
jgi:hypothetical protein